MKLAAAIASSMAKSVSSSPVCVVVVVIVFFLHKQTQVHPMVVDAYETEEPADWRVAQKLLDATNDLCQMGYVLSRFFSSLLFMSFLFLGISRSHTLP